MKNIKNLGKNSHLFVFFAFNYTPPYVPDKYRPDDDNRLPDENMGLLKNIRIILSQIEKAYNPHEVENKNSGKTNQNT